MARTQHGLETRTDTQAQIGFSVTDRSSLFSFPQCSPGLKILLQVTKWMGFTASGCRAPPLRRAGDASVLLRAAHGLRGPAAQALLQE